VAHSFRSVATRAPRLCVAQLVQRFLPSRDRRGSQIVVRQSNGPFEKAGLVSRLSREGQPKSPPIARRLSRG
jgi:hypothetical protein